MSYDEDLERWDQPEAVGVDVNRLRADRDAVRSLAVDDARKNMAVQGVFAGTTLARVDR